MDYFVLRTSPSQQIGVVLKCLNSEFKNCLKKDFKIMIGIDSTTGKMSEDLVAHHLMSKTKKKNCDNRFPQDG